MYRIFARALEKLRADVIKAGCPVASHGHFNAVEAPAAPQPEA